MSNTQLIKIAEKCSDAADTLVDAVNSLLNIVPTFPERVTEQESDDINTGLLNRAIAKTKDRYFLRDGDTYTKVDSAEAKKAPAHKVVTLTADSVMALTSHELAQLTTQEPGRSAIVKAFRKAVQTSASNRRNYIEGVAVRERKAKGENVGNPKRPTGAVMDRTYAALANIEKMHKTARTKGDPTALPVEVTKAAEAAYVSVINKAIK